MSKTDRERLLALGRKLIGEVKETKFENDEVTLALARLVSKLSLLSIQEFGL